MPLRLEPVAGDFAAFASGVDLSRPQDAETLRSIVEAVDRYAVLVFRDQALTQAQQLAFARQLGPLESAVAGMLRQYQSRMEYAEVSDISNVDLSGKVAARDSEQAMMNIGNRIWHTDASFMELPWRYSLLYAVATEVTRGGETEWCDLRAAYDALHPDDKALAESLVAEHYAGQSRAVLGYNTGSPASRAAAPPVRWPLVRTHAGSKRKLLFVTNAIREIMGMSLPEGRALVQELIEHATQRQFVFSHSWRPGDVAMWDNRCTLHRGRRWDMNERREMRRVATIDDVRSLPIDEASRTKVYGQPCI